MIKSGWVGGLALLGGSACRRRRRRYRRRGIFQSEGMHRRWGVKDTIVFLLSFSSRSGCILGWITNN